MRNPHEFRARRTPPNSRSPQKVVRISLGGIYRDFDEARALSIADKIVDLVEQHRADSE